MPWYSQRVHPRMIQAQFASILPEQVVDQNHGPEQQHLERKENAQVRTSQRILCRQS